MLSLLLCWFSCCAVLSRPVLCCAVLSSPAALVFAQIGPMDVGLAVFTGRLGWLADRIVPCGPKQAARSKQEWVKELQRRLQPVVRSAKL